MSVTFPVFYISKFHDIDSFSIYLNENYPLPILFQSEKKSFMACHTPIVTMPEFL